MPQIKLKPVNSDSFEEHECKLTGKPPKITIVVFHGDLRASLIIFLDTFESRLGEGSGGTVWKATSTTNNKKLAIKLYRSKNDMETCKQVMLLSDTIRESKRDEMKFVNTIRSQSTY